VRVLFVDQFSELGGAQLVLRDILVEARRRGWHVELMAPGDGGLVDFCRNNAIPVHRLPIGRYASGGKSMRDVLRYGPEMARAALAVRSLVSRSQIELVVANGPRILPAAVAGGCPVVFHLHSRPEKKYARAIVRWSLRCRHARTICVSNFVAENLHGSFRVIYNGVPDQGFVGYRVRNGPPRVGIIGRIAPEKGHMDFVRAADVIAKSGRDVRFTVHGAPLFSDPSFEKEVRRLAGPSVEFHGWTDNVAQVLHEIDLLVVPSASVESTPRVVMEALSAGTPVIAYPSGGIPELIRDGVTGLLTKRPDYQSLAECINDLLADPGRMADLSRNGRQEWEDRFRVERFQRDVCDLLESSAKKPGKP
jgi:glycosyltransferase involved in cell wall biosynthesis